ncbi:MAG: hypothetical protein ACRDND_08890 [Streptosporangiaceae bacterium]
MIIKRTRRYLTGMLGIAVAATVAVGALALTGTRSQAGTSGVPGAKQALIQKQEQRLGGRPVAWDRAHPALARQRLEAAAQRLHAEAQTFRASYRAAGDRIVDTRDSAFTPGQFRVQNTYDGTLNGRGIRVSAGCAVAAAASGCGPGAIGIWADQAGAPGGLAEVGVFPARATSPLTITAFHGTHLTLRSSAGQTYTFSLTTHRFS